MRLTDPYWTPDPQFEPRVFQNTKIAGVKQDDNGIRYNAPPSLPEGVNWYQGSNEYALDLPRRSSTHGKRNSTHMETKSQAQPAGH